MIVGAITNVISGSWAMIAIFSVVLITVRVLYIVDKNEKFVFYEELINFLFIIYALILYNLLTNTEGVSKGLNLIPFREILRYKTGTELFYYNVIGNILIFIPFGFYLSKHVEAKKASHILIATLIVSFTIEAVQFHIGRAFDVDDIILNVVGGICGFLLYIALSAIKNHLPKFLKKNSFYNLVAAIFLILIVFYIIKVLGLGW